MIATSKFTSISFPGFATVLPTARVDEHRRTVSPEASRALEKLAHAIEYLSNDFLHDNGPGCDHDGRVQAIHLLMALNRAVYFECPEVPALGERLRAFFRMQA